MRLRDLQDKLPWRSKYSDAFERGPAHRHFGHALHHVAKALGKLVELQDDLDHKDELVYFNLKTGAQVSAQTLFGKYVADLPILAARLANEFPGGKLDLEAIVRERVAEKNGVVFCTECDVSCDGNHVCPNCKEWYRSLDAHICGQNY